MLCPVDGPLTSMTQILWERLSRQGATTTNRILSSAIRFAQNSSTRIARTCLLRSHYHPKQPNIFLNTLSLIELNDKKPRFLPFRNMSKLSMLMKH